MTVDGEENPRDRVFMDIAIGGLPSGRIVFELFNDVAPKTCENFRALCAGDKGVGKNTGKPLTYKGMVFHRVVKDFMIQGGDFSNANGTGGESIYGGTFEDETFELKHERPFLLSMANRGKDTNGSQFFITTQPAPHLDNVHVVFGQVVNGATLVRQLEALPVDRNARPLQDIIVTNCGQLVKLKAGKKRKQDKEKEKEKDESDAESEKSHKKEKKKKKDKKKKRHQSEQSEGEQTSEPSHPLVSTTKIDPKEIPDVPTNRFLMRATRDEKEKDTRRDRERPRYRERERHAYTRSGRIVKGRGVFRYRTPSRSRSRSRSVTPPHWRQAQRRIVKLADFERNEHERVQENLKKPVVKQSQRVTNTPPRQGEKEEGECDTTLEQSRDGKVDYNALDFEEDVDQDEEGEIPSKRMEQKRLADNRADILARALGVNPKHDQLRDMKDTRDFRRREGISSAVVQAAPKLSSAVAPMGSESQNKGEYDPFTLLRSTFSRNKEQVAKKEVVEIRREVPKDKEREKYRNERNDQPDLRESLRKRENRDDRNDKEDLSKDDRHKRTDKYKVNEDKNERYRAKTKSPELSPRTLDRFEKNKRDEKSHDREPKRQRDMERRSQDNTPDRPKSRESKDRKRDKSKDRSKERRDRSRDKYDRSKERRDRSKDRRGSKERRDRSKDRRDKSKDRRDKSKDRSKRNRSERDSKDKELQINEFDIEGRSKEKIKSGKVDPGYRQHPDTFDIEGRKTKSPQRERKVSSSDGKEKDEQEKKKEEERNEARKELMEIVRLIKSRQRDRENKAAEAKKKKRDSSSSSSEDERSKRRRTPDRDRRRSRSRSRRSTSRSRRRSLSPRRRRRRSSD
ncbi:unnamed protein product [Pieris macdunnoughi]|uniref:peptidylprolyl isomerase n=1 Tax=Pieris macdunnoughi TaxID=345717 RepID=A0A821Q3V2_9NEOP|nr:unnamed protein product [Pieris macdunnoughi]